MADVLTRRRVIGFKLEAAIGTYETNLDSNITLLSENSADFFIEDPSFTQEPVSFDRNIRLSSMARPKMYTSGVSKGTITFTVEVAGHKDNDGVQDDVISPFERLMSCCGMQSQEVNHLELASWTTTDGTYAFEHGETINGSTAAVLTAFGDSNELDTATTLWYEETPSGLPTTTETLTAVDSLTAAITESSGVPEAQTNRGLKLISARPVNSAVTGTHTASIVYIMDGREVKLRGCVGNAVINYKVFERTTATFTFTGIYQGVAATRTFPEGYGTTGGPTINQLRPAPFLSNEMSFDLTPGATTAISPKCSTVSLDLGNVVALHDNAARVEGWASAFVESRAPTLTIDIDEIDTTATQYEEQFNSAGEFHVRFTNCLNSNTGNVWEFRAPAAVIQARPEGDRDGVTHHNTTFNLTAGKGKSAHYGVDSEFTFVNY